MVQGCQEVKYSQKMSKLRKNKVHLLTFLPKMGILNLAKIPRLLNGRVRQTTADFDPPASPTALNMRPLSRTLFGM